jgi:CRP-like cAMP-binding protein
MFEAHPVRRLACIKLLAAQRLVLPAGQEMALDSISRSPNGFLSALAADDFELLRPLLRSADLIQESILAASGETLKRAYFPHRGVISLVVNLAKGDHVQVAMIGRDSILGSFAALGDATALNSAVVLVPGFASTIDIDRLRAAADQSATLRSLLIRHGLAVYAQIQQTAGCNASHPVESRLARCLLQTHDLSCGCKFVLTQESMAQMIGARRNSVSLVASTLQQANFIHYSRGHIEIVNLEGLSRTACECYASVKAQYERLLGQRCVAEDSPRGRTGSSSK